MQQVEEVRALLGGTNDFGADEFRVAVDAVDGLETAEEPTTDPSVPLDSDSDQLERTATHASVAAMHRILGETGVGRAHTELAELRTWSDFERLDVCAPAAEKMRLVRLAKIAETAGGEMCFGMRMAICKACIRHTLGMHERCIRPALAIL